MNPYNFKNWLKDALSSEYLQKIEVRITESKENFQEDNVHLEAIYFVSVKGTKIDGEVKMYYLVARCMKNIEVLKEQDHLMEAYRKEMYVYTKMIPYFMGFRNVKKLGRFQGFPQFIGIYTLDSFDAVVLYDLEKYGFTKINRNTRLLNDEQLLMIAEEYGKLHAISASLRDQDVALYDKIMKGLADRRPYYYEIFKNQLKHSPKDLFHDLNEEQWGEIQAGILNVLHPGHCSHVFTMVLHGDFWNSNIMLRQNPNASCRKSLDVVFTDWHYCRVGAPILDIIFAALNTLNVEKARVDIYPAILCRYYQSLVENGKLYGTKIDEDYSLARMWKDYNAFGIFAKKMQPPFSQQDERVKPIADLYLELV